MYRIPLLEVRIALVAQTTTASDEVRFVLAVDVVLFRIQSLRVGLRAHHLPQFARLKRSPFSRTKVSGLLRPRRLY